MENITMTIDATQTNRVRFVCPEAGRTLLAPTSGWVQGSTASAIGYGSTTTFRAPKTTSMDVAHLRPGAPPV